MLKQPKKINDPMRKNAIFSEMNLDKLLWGEKLVEGVNGVREQVHTDKWVARSFDGGSESEKGLLQV